jgi:SAM-dependent methyltransferase
MTLERNPQAEQMAHDSMLSTLAAQADAIWPAEEALFHRYGLAGSIHVIDVGCGSGEITSRLAGLYPEAQVLGIDILESSVEYACRRHASLAPRVTFQQGDAFQLDLLSSGADLVVCRHVTQAVPEAPRVLAELVRVCRSGGWVHVLSEDYGMLHMPVGSLDPDRLWLDGALLLHVPPARMRAWDATLGATCASWGWPSCAWTTWWSTPSGCREPPSRPSSNPGAMVTPRCWGNAHVSRHGSVSAV